MIFDDTFIDGIERLMRNNYAHSMMIGKTFTVSAGALIKFLTDLDAQVDRVDFLKKDKNLVMEITLREAPSLSDTAKFGVLNEEHTLKMFWGNLSKQDYARVKVFFIPFKFI